MTAIIYTAPIFHAISSPGRFRSYRTDRSMGASKPPRSTSSDSSIYSIDRFESRSVPFEFGAVLFLSNFRPSMLEINVPVTLRGRLSAIEGCLPSGVLVTLRWGCFGVAGWNAKSRRWLGTSVPRCGIRSVSWSFTPWGLYRDLATTELYSRRLPNRGGGRAVSQLLLVQRISTRHQLV